MYKIVRSSPMYSPKIARLLVKFTGDVRLIVREGQDMVDFLRTPEINIQAIERKAIAGDRDAQYEIAMIYLDGTDDVKQNLDKAGYWFACAARQDHADSFYRLGLMYDQGVGFKQDLDRAVEMYESAGYLGHLEALRQLGSMAKTGRGIDQDFLEAYCWYQLAYQFGDMTIKKELEFLESQEKKVKREYQDLKGTALSQRKIAFLSGLHGSCKNSLLYTKLRVKLKELQQAAPGNNAYKTEADILRMVFEFSGDSLLLVNPGIEMTDFLKQDGDDDSETDEKSNADKLSSPRIAAGKRPKLSGEFGDKAKNGNKGSVKAPKKTEKEGCILS
jgi:TPR repeat protein